VPRAPLASWLLSALLVVAATAGAALLAKNAEAGPVPPFVAGTLKPTPAGLPAHGPGLELAGSGSNLPLTRKLVEAFAGGGGAAAHVHDSIGSTGAVHAVREGAVEIGLLSRSLAGDGRAELRSHPYARVAVVLAVHPSVTDADITSDELLALYRGERRRWHNGSPAIVLQRERGDSGHRVVDRVLPAFAAVNAEAWSQHRFRVLYSDGAMQAALLDVPGSVGVFDAGAIATHRLPLKALRIDGVSPTVESLEGGRYPFFKQLSFVLRGEPSARARAFLDFVYGAQGQAVIRRHGYLPIGRGSAP